jgi:hypothetical protein
LERKDRSKNLINSKIQTELPTIPEFFHKKTGIHAILAIWEYKKRGFALITNLKYKKCKNDVSGSFSINYKKSPGQVPGAGIFKNARF